MRVISGEYGGRHLKGLKGDTTRPTTDKVKESIFNIIGPYFDGGICYDMFAGSGGIAIEAVSRGMDQAILFERDRQAQMVIQENIAMTKEENKFTLVKGDSKKLVHRYAQEASLIFFDPPYKQQTIVADILRLNELGMIGQETLVVCETDAKTFLPETIGPLKQFKRNTYGTIAVAFYEVEA